MSATAALAHEGTRPRRRLVAQLWFWVIVAICLGIVFGLVAPDQRAGLVTLTASLQAFGGEFFNANSIAVGIALVVGIDRIMSEGRALTNATGNSVATMVIAGWAGERDDERFRAVLAEPSIVDREVERALSGADADGEGGDGTGAPPRFERDPATGAHVPAGARPER
jgi:aerobic C4-dicarboxylate transport protein